MKHGKTILYRPDRTFRQKMFTKNKTYMRNTFISLCIGAALSSCLSTSLQTKSGETDMVFPALSHTWDEGIPLGNATIGALIWQRDSLLRFSIDRTDLWDLRPTDSLSGPDYKFSWVCKQVKKGDYLPVQKKLDYPYDQLPAPSKIPGAAIEFSTSGFGKIKNVHLYLKNALCEATWENGVRLKTFVHAHQPVGWFVFENLPHDPDIRLAVPPYNKKEKTGINNPVDGQDLVRLGYKQGRITRGEHTISYHQPGWGNFFYDVNIRWKTKGNRLYGVWSITSSMVSETAMQETLEAFERGLTHDYASHLSFWNSYWDASSVSVPDSILQRQYTQEIYRLGCIAREYSYPISLQAVWTADNGKLPPWKGDYHHDLNTELSYWPVYTGNHLKEGMGYLNTLWNQRETYKKYTKEYFGCGGMNVPGVCTLTGEPMGGWIQYSMSPTTGAWLAHHFYLHWKYSADKEFLRERAYPFIKEVATFLEQITTTDARGIRQLPLSSSPEIYDNSIKAWFHTMTNYDLSLIRFAFHAAEEMADSLRLPRESGHWNTLAHQLPDFNLDKDGALTFAEGFPYNESHRHFSHAMAIHPLGLIDCTNGEKDKKIILATLRKIKEQGSDWWCGYSYAWLANMEARAHDGDAAAQDLRTFATCFCLANGFHANGDQTNSGKSKFTYRPFTLEGNMAFAAGLQEMLLQSHAHAITIFPAIPRKWKEVSFRNLRARRAFLVSATLHHGKLTHARIVSEKGGVLRIANTFGNAYQLIYKGKPVSCSNQTWEVKLSKGDSCIIKQI